MCAVSSVAVMGYGEYCYSQKSTGEGNHGGNTSKASCRRGRRVSPHAGSYSSYVVKRKSEARGREALAGSVGIFVCTTLLFKYLRETAERESKE